jgi:hypothetical protein
MKNPVQWFSLNSQEAFAGQVYNPYDERFLSNAPAEFHQLLANLKYNVRKSIYPIKTTYTWRPYPKANIEDVPVWIHGTRTGQVTVVTYRGKMYALSVSHLVMPTARDLNKERIQINDDIRTEMYVGNNSVVLDQRILDQTEEIAIFKIPESLNVKPLTYDFGDADKLELGDMIVVIAPRDVRIGAVTALHGEDPIRDLELGTPQNTFLTDIPVMPGFSGSLSFVISKFGLTPYIIGLTEGFYIKRHEALDGYIREDFQSVIIRINKFKELIEENFF